MKQPENRKKPAPWRIAVAILSFAYILFLWVKKDILSIYATMPQERIVPLIVITIAVTLLKVAVIAGGALLIKWVIGKLKNN